MHDEIGDSREEDNMPHIPCISPGKRRIIIRTACKQENGTNNTKYD